MTIEEQVNDGIKNAMKAHDKVRLETMRNIKKVILEAKTRPGANDRIDDAECIKLIQKLSKQGKESAEIYRQQGREDLYEQESGQVSVPITEKPNVPEKVLSFWKSVFTAFRSI